MNLSRQQRLFKRRTSRVAAATLAFMVLTSALAIAQSEPPPASPTGDLSLQLEVERAIERGLAWLREQQDPATGAWSDSGYPALTALPVIALHGASKEPDPSASRPIDRGLAFILGCRRDDGGIYTESLATYNTSLCLLARTLAGDPAVESAIVAARKFLIAQQADYDEAGATDNPFDGGIGYGGTYTHSDLSNSHLALEALYHSRKRLADSAAAPDPGVPGTTLDWDAALRFIERCQNLPGSNDQGWASDDPDNRGGFIYFPGDSKAGTQSLPDGRLVPRSYGSMTYAGLLSFIYAELEAGDPRVTAALDWLRAHYTVEENPGMKDEGLFYYYHTMAKALNIAGIKELELQNGRRADWRLDLARKLFDLQGSDGSWVNDSGRWWEKDPVLVTSYAVLALEHLHSSL